MNPPSLPCPCCGGIIPEGAPQGICPRCLLGNAMNPAEAPADSPAPLGEIARIFPHLEILQFIGSGGMGRVYKVRQRHLDRIVALKILQPELAGDPAFAERFAREGRALAKLTHPNIVSVYDFGKAGELYWLLMQYVDGVNLRQAMQPRTIKPRQALQIIPMICAALEYAHGQGVMHRDIKPENILIDAQGLVKIADFGVAKMRGEGRHITLTLSGSALGTPAYMAPEQIERPQDVDHRADIYSLGVVFYEMLTGELPLGRFPAPSEKAGTDPRLDSVVFRTLEKERERRYQSAGEMKTHVESCAAAPSGSGPFSRRPVSRKARLAAGITAAGLLGGAALAVAIWSELDRKAQSQQVYSWMKPSGEPVSLMRQLLHLPHYHYLWATFLFFLLGLGGYLGFSAMKDIRAADGKMEAAKCAVFAAGWLPVFLLINALSAVSVAFSRAAGDRPGIWSIMPFFAGLLGVGLGRWMYRYTLNRVSAGEGSPPTAAGRIAGFVTAGGCVLAGAMLNQKSGSLGLTGQPSTLLAPATACLIVGLFFSLISIHERGGKLRAVISGMMLACVLSMY